MVKFKSIPGKKVALGGKVIRFTEKEYETSDKKEIEALRKAKQVIEIKSQ